MKQVRIVRMLTIAAGTVVCFYVAWFAVGLLLVGSPCANELLAEVASPDGKWKAVVFQRGCGATTGFSTQVSLLPAASVMPNESGNAFRSDTNHGAAPSGPGGGPAVGVVWRSPIELAISHHPAARVFAAERSVGNVEVRYEQFTPTGG